MKVYIVPEVISTCTEDMLYTTCTMAEAVVSGVIGGVVGAMIPGPGIPG